LLVVTSMSVKLLFLVVILSILALVASLSTTYWLTRRTIDPLVALAQHVANIDDLSQKITLPQTKSDDEVGVLSCVLQHAFDQNYQALQRESDFTRDVGHELRTPLTIIKNSITLAQMRPLTDNENAELARQVAQMQQRISVLMALARAESIMSEPVRLRETIEQSLLMNNHLLEQVNFNVDINVAYAVQVNANAELVTMLCDNLIENALRYASTPQLTIRADQHQLSFSNLTDELPDNLMEPAIKSEHSKGIGQGLYLVARIAEALGWQYHTYFSQGEFSIEFTFKK